VDAEAKRYGAVKDGCWPGCASRGEQFGTLRRRQPLQWRL